MYSDVLVRVLSVRVSAAQYEELLKVRDKLNAELDGITAVEVSDIVRAAICSFCREEMTHGKEGEQRG